MKISIIRPFFTNNTSMKKTGQKRVIFFIIIAILIVVVFVTTPLVVFFVTTKNDTLDKSKFLTKTATIKITSATGNTLQNTNTSIKINELHDYTINAFIAKEDKRFFEHNGFDIIRIFGALKNNIFAGRIVEGGSTITQQLIKNTHTNSERTLKRKMTEIKLAKEMEKNYSKNQILEMYLNNIYFGNNCFGIEQASNTYFGKSARNLSIEESAVLAGLISAPSVYNPISDLNLSIQKGKLVLKLMHEQNKLNSNEYSLAQKNIEKLAVFPLNTASSIYLGFAISEACDILGVEDLDQSKNIKIETYLDENTQQFLENEILSGKYSFANKNGIMPETGAVILDNETGGIIATAGDGNNNLSLIKRQPASTIKPILVYAPAIEYLNYVPASVILDEPINIAGYTPHNATKLNYGYTSIRDNLVRSTNIPAVKLLNEVGVDRAKSFAESVGIEFDPNDNNLALALGGFTNGVTLNSLAGAYASFACGGEYIKPSYIKKITVDDKVVYERKTQKSRVMSSETAYMITDMLKSVAQYGTGRKINSLGSYIASKTGTNSTEENNLDAWNVSYTTKHTMVAWTGNTSGTEGSMHPSINGSTYTTLLVKSLFSYLYKDQTPANFAKPNTIVTLPIDVDLLESEHKIYLAGTQSKKTKKEIFKVTNIPPNYEQEKLDIINAFEQIDSLFKTKIM